MHTKYVVIKPHKDKEKILKNSQRENADHQQRNDN